MKRILFTYTYIASFSIALLFSINSKAQDLDASNFRMLFNFKTVKQADNSRLLEVSFIARNKKNRKDKVPVYDAEIQYFNTLGDQEILLGNSKTSKKGISQLELPENQEYLVDGDGYINFIARFEGSDGIDEESEELMVKNLHLSFDLTEIDSVKTVLVKAFTIDSLGVETPVEEVDFFIAVKGMLSKMKLEEGTIEEGEYEYEFPTNIPGDANKDITVYSIVEDHEDYGNVIQSKTVNWGSFDKQSDKSKNMLWSEVAPLWMYIVLTILLGGVWINYVYSVVNLFKIRKEGKELLAEQETDSEVESE